METRSASTPTACSNSAPARLGGTAASSSPSTRRVSPGTSVASSPPISPRSSGSESRAPSDPVEEDDREIALEDPAIATPVYWLGREFEPAGLPKLELDRADHLRGEGSGNEVKIDYQSDGGGVNLDLWKPEAWRTFKTTRLGRMIWSSQCARRSELNVEGGRAEIYGGYSQGCAGEPDHWLAHVYYDEVVVAVNMAYCYACGGRGRAIPTTRARGWRPSCAA